MAPRALSSLKDGQVGCPPSSSSRFDAHLRKLGGPRKWTVKNTFVEPEDPSGKSGKEEEQEEEEEEDSQPYLSFRSCSDLSASRDQVALAYKATVASGSADGLIRAVSDNYQEAGPAPAPAAASQVVVRQAEPSVGSSGHNSGDCKPCAWHWKPGGCIKGPSCGFCHMCPEGVLKACKRLKQKELKRYKAQQRAAAAAAAAIETKAENDEQQEVKSPKGKSHTVQGTRRKAPASLNPIDLQDPCSSQDGTEDEQDVVDSRLYWQVIP